MSKRTAFTTITPLPPGVSRETVLDTLHDHLLMIDLNPAHETRRKMERPPPEASPEEYHCAWYEITDKISYFPGVKGRVSFRACFHDLASGLQTHCYAPMGLDLKEKWTLAGNLPGEASQPAEIGIGAPITGLYLREDVEMRCNFLMTRFVRGTLKECLEALVARLLVKSQITEAATANTRLTHHQSMAAVSLGHTYSTSGTPSPTFTHSSPPGSPPPLSPPTSAPLVGPGNPGMGMTLPPDQYQPSGPGVRAGMGVSMGMPIDQKDATYVGMGYPLPSPQTPHQAYDLRASYPAAVHGQNPYLHQQHLQSHDPSVWQQQHQPGQSQPHGPPPIPDKVVEMPDTQTGDKAPIIQTAAAELPS